MSKISSFGKEIQHKLPSSRKSWTSLGKRRKHYQLLRLHKDHRRNLNQINLNIRLLFIVYFLVLSFD